MLPALGGGSSLRGFSSWRFRDQNSLLLQAEWRIMVNRYLDMAFFYDAGKVAARTPDLDFDGLKDDYGIGLRFHGPFATPLRVEMARSRESNLSFIFSSSALFLGLAHAQFNVLRPARRRRPGGLSACAVGLFATGASTQAPRFYPDDPIAREPGVAGRLEGGALRAVADVRADCSTCSSTPGHEPSGLRAKNINTVDEVPDSSWFTNRIGTRPITAEEIARGPNVGAPPDPSKWVLIREKTAGAHPGFTAMDAQGRDLVPRVRSAVGARGRDRQRSRSRPRSSGPWATTRSSRS